VIRVQPQVLIVVNTKQDALTLLDVLNDTQISICLRCSAARIDEML
jgi:hypothetical protein